MSGRTSSVPIADDQLVIDYQKACSEVIVLRKGLVEILESVRQHDGILKINLTVSKNVKNLNIFCVLRDEWCENWIADSWTTGNSFEQRTAIRPLRRLLGYNERKQFGSRRKQSSSREDSWTEICCKQYTFSTNDFERSPSGRS